MSKLIDNRSSDKIKNVMKMRVQPIGMGQRPESPQSEEYLDPFRNRYSVTAGSLRIIEPPISLKPISQMKDISSEIGPDIDAMKVNIERTGWKIVPRYKVAQRNEKLPTNIKSELSEIENFFNNCVLDQEIGSFTELRARLRDDLELTGMFYVEVLPARNDKRIPAGLKHIPSWTMRITYPDVEFTEYSVPRAIKIDDHQWKIEDKYTSKRFRRYVQIDPATASEIWFKEYNDPRPISKRDGRVISQENDNLDDEEAHEVIFKRYYSSTSPYGYIKWYGSIFSLYGQRAAEEINFTSLDNNQIPASLLLATNVEVTQGSIDRLNTFFEESVQGDRNYAKLVLVEAEPIGEGMKDPNSMKLDIEKLSDTQIRDAMFKEYIKLCADNIRKSWRLPPVLVGATSDYTKATAVASRHVAEQQVFVPERDDIDEFWTSIIVLRLRKAYVKFKSHSPKLTDGFELTQLLATAEGSGGLTPRTSTMIVEDVTNTELPEPDPSIDPDVPFSLTKERERAKLFAEAQESTNNPNQENKSIAKIKGASDLINFVVANDEIPETIKEILISRLSAVQDSDE